jgi:hypothetical protein
MLSDAVTAKIQAGEAREGIQVLDVSQILARSLAAPSVGEPVGAAAGTGETSVVEGQPPTT